MEPQPGAGSVALAALQDRTLETLRPHLSSGDEIALLDFPRHQNAGDSLIWRGTRHYLARLGVGVRFVASLHSFHPDDVRRRLPRGKILINGGGNFGDRYPYQQDFRERVVAAFPDRAVIQLPSSLEFTDERKLERAQQVLGAHPDLTLLMRDHASQARARTWFPTAYVEFCPDLAFGVGELGVGRTPSHEVTLLLRTDTEALPREITFPEEWRVRRVEWGLTGADKVAFRAARLPEDVSRVIPALRQPLQPVIAGGFDLSSRLNTRAAQRIVRSGKVLITDRLHAMIFGRLQGIPTIAFDNANGKVAELYRASMADLGGVTLVSRAEEAVEAAARFLSPGSPP